MFYWAIRSYFWEQGYISALLDMAVQHPGLGANRLIKNTIVLVIILLLSQTAEATYSFEGVPYTDKLNTVAHGTLNGGVYIDGGYGLKFTPYTNTFDVPGGVKWARVYVGIWGGTENYEGWVQMNLNGNDLGKTSLLGKNDNECQCLLFWLWDLLDIL